MENNQAAAPVIASEHYFTGWTATTARTHHAHNPMADIPPASRVPLSLLMFCVLVLADGSTAVGHARIVAPDDAGKADAKQRAKNTAVWNSLNTPVGGI